MFGWMNTDSGVWADDREANKADASAVYFDRTMTVITAG